MRFPNSKNSGRHSALRVLAIFVLAFAFAGVGQAQKNVKRFNQIVQAPTAPSVNSAASLEQCRNGQTATNPLTGCTTVGGNEGWVTGNAGSANSHWAETQFLSYRMLFTGLTIGGSNTVTIGYDIFKSGVHAIDYLGTYNATETNANPCIGVSGCSGPTSTFPIPPDNDQVTPFISQIPGVFTMWGGTINTIAYETYAGGEERRITLTFTPSVANPVLAWGGHVAWRGDWGNGQSAGGITGSPYHMRLIDLDGSGGNQDRSLSADAVLATGVVKIVKEVFIDGQPAVSPLPFTFDPSANFNGDANFQLMDDGIPGNDTLQQAVILFGAANAITVSEVGLPSGWSIQDVNCVETASLGFPNVQNSTKSPNLGPASIIVEEGEFVTCTFQNSFLHSTAAPASVIGRVTSGGRGVSGARLTMWNTSTGELVTRTTNSFGYYRFDNLSVSSFYVVSVDKKGISFANSTRSFTLQEDLIGLNFSAN